MTLHRSLPVGTVFLDEVLEEIAAALTTHAPERGGLLFGPRGQKLVTLFVEDNEAAHSRTTYTPSAWISLRCPRIERETGLEYKGLVHSHPGSYDKPSLPDRNNARRALTRNPHLGHFLMPIVTLGHPDRLRPFETLLQGGKLSLYQVPAHLPPGAPGTLPERISVLSLREDVRAFGRLLPGSPAPGRATLLDIEGVQAPAYSLGCHSGPWLVAATAGYPFTPPLVIPPGSNSLPLSWDLAVPASDRLLHSLRPHLASV